MKPVALAVPAFSNTIALRTIVVKEVRRFMRIWVQTLLPPAITMALYFIIFGQLVGSRLGNMAGFSYIDFIVPGLIMMSVITNAYANVVSSFFGNKFQRCIEELLVSPTPEWIILIGYILGGVVRAILVGVIVTALSLFFSDFHMHNLAITLTVMFLTATLFASAGLINALFAKKFDDISIVPTFVLTPLTYLGGVFYSLDLLSPFWQKVSLLNPIVYMVDTFRYGFLGYHTMPVMGSIAMILVFNLVLFWVALTLLKKGVGTRL